MSFLSGVGKLAGAAGGFLLGGPAGAAAGYGLASSLGGGGGDSGGSSGGNLNAATAQQGQYATQDRNRYLDALNGGQEAVNTSTKAAVDSALPSFMQNLQSTRESAIRRGASNGDLETSNEGDLTSAFQRNIAAGAGAQATSIYGQKTAGLGALANGSSNNYLDLLSGGADREQAGKNNTNNLWGSVIGAVGTGAGAYYGSH